VRIRFAESAKQPLRPFTEKVFKEFVVERQNDLVTARVALSSAAAKQLPVYAPRFVAFSRKNMQATNICYTGLKSDIRAPPCHVGRHSNPATRSGHRNDFGLFFVLTSVQDTMR
jgi:hypothetical protein